MLFVRQVLQRRQGMTSGGLTIKELNDLLDRLASSENRHTYHLFYQVFDFVVFVYSFFCSIFLTELNFPLAFGFVVPVVMFFIV